MGAIDFITDHPGAAAIVSIINVLLGVWLGGWVSSRSTGRFIKSFQSWYMKTSEIKLVTDTLVKIVSESSLSLSEKEEAAQVAEFQMCRELFADDIHENKDLEKQFRHFHYKVIHGVPLEDSSDSTGQILAKIIKLINQQAGKLK